MPEGTFRNTEPVTEWLSCCGKPEGLHVWERVLYSMYESHEGQLLMLQVICYVMCTAQMSNRLKRPLFEMPNKKGV